MKQRTIGPLISVVIPAFDCAEVIYSSLQQLTGELGKQGFRYELIVVIDGKDEQILTEVAKLSSDKISILHYEKNKGKGFAVKLGMENAKGDYVGYIDAGGDISPVSLIHSIHEILKGEVAIICGSKKHKDSKVINYSKVRRIYTWGYNTLVKVILGIDYKDTQVGLKMYTSHLVKNVLPRLLVKRFAFEVEMLAVANMVGYRDHVDVPVQIKFRSRSTAATFNSIFRMAWDTLAVFYRMRILRYYQRVDKETLARKKHKELLNIKFL